MYSIAEKYLNALIEIPYYFNFTSKKLMLQRKSNHSPCSTVLQKKILLLLWEGIKLLSLLIFKPKSPKYKYKRMNIL